MEQCKECGRGIDLRMDTYVEIEEVFPEGTKFKLHKECYESIGGK